MGSREFPTAAELVAAAPSVEQHSDSVRGPAAVVTPWTDRLPMSQPRDWCGEGAAGRCRRRLYWSGGRRCGVVSHTVSKLYLHAEVAAP